jgi:hypothetical protein
MMLPAQACILRLVPKKSTQKAQSVYVPGMCNINTAEIAYRRKYAYGGTILAAVILVGLLATGQSWWWRFAIFLPLLVGVVNTLQVRNKFCVTYGSSGLQNAEENSRTAKTVKDQSALAQDRAKASSMNRKAFNITLLITAFSLLLPA